MDDSVLPWPECLGAFDEESCRSLLRELGQRIVQSYPFSVGMEEVLTQLVDEYGFNESADAIGFLRDLLEDDSTATGIGDDGDIWRSWRHAWRHRNDDVHNPYVPRVRGRILPVPTSTRVRLLKTANHTVLELSRSKSASQLESPFSLFDAGEFDIKTGGDVGDEAVSLLASGGRRSYHGAPGIAAEPSIEGTLAPTSVLCEVASSPRTSLPLPSRMLLSSCKVLPPKRTDSMAAAIVMDGPCAPPRTESTEGKPFDNGEISHRLVNEKTKPTLPPMAMIGERDTVLRKTPLSECRAKMENRLSLPSDFESVRSTFTPTRQRAVHRQAQMIDGALFHFKTRKVKLVCRGGQDTASTVKGPNRVPLDAERPARASWLRNLITRFHGKQSRKQSEPSLRKQRSSLVDCVLVHSQRRGYDATFETEEGISYSPEMESYTVPISMLGLDGMWEQDNNKPLPLSPLDYSTRPSLQSETERLFFNHSPTSTTCNVHKLCGSITATKANNSNQLQSLVSATMSGPHELSPMEKARYRLSAASSQSAPSTLGSYTTFANQNPYNNAIVSKSPSKPSHESPDRRENEAPVSSRLVDTENEYMCSQRRNRDEHLHNYKSKRIQQDIHRDGPYDIGDNQVRGRTPRTPPTSPSRHDFKGASPPKTPRPRSRSPMKKLVGMVKSMSTNHISAASTPPASSTTTSTGKKRWKELSNKLRHGFLTADLQQLEQEELMEHYALPNQLGDTCVATQPLTHERSVFPVSIKSSGQSKLWSELEYMLIETCNDFIKKEVEEGRISRESVLRIKRQWQAHNRPQVIEFYYDQANQYNFVIANLPSIKLYSDYAQDAIMLNSVLHQWKILIRELSIKTLCMPDSIVRRWLHDGRRVLELLGADTVTLVNIDKLTTLCMAVIGSAEKARSESRKRSASEGSQITLHDHEAALLTGTHTQPPPLPLFTGASSDCRRRKITPQELQEHLRRKAPGRSPTAANQFVRVQGADDAAVHDQIVNNMRTHWHGYSKSQGLTPREERARFVFD